MVDVDKAVIARLKIGGENFEILVDCEKAMEFKQGKSISLDKILASGTNIFSDVKKGEHAPESTMNRLFGTNDKMQIATDIIKKGEVQLTVQYRNKMREEKRKNIIDIIHRNAIDPRTGLPHPAARIERAMEEAKIRIDEMKNAEEQVQDVVKDLREILPLKFETRQIAVKIPAQYSGNCFRILKSYGKLLKDEWQNDGSLVAIVELPAGLQEEFFEKLNGLTHGDVETKIIATR